MTKPIADALTPIERGDLHAMLDSLLDSADSSTDALDPTTFWTFMHVLALGRGIGDDLHRAAEADIAQNAPRPDDPAQKWRTWQGLILGHVLGRLDAGGEGAILPQSFNVTAMKAHAHNIADRKPELPDMFRHGKEAQSHTLGKNRAQLFLVGAVVAHEVYHNTAQAEARRALLPKAGHPTELDRENKGFYSTWHSWVKRAEAEGTADRATAAAYDARKNGTELPHPFLASPDEIGLWWEAATMRREK